MKENYEAKKERKKLQRDVAEDFAKKLGLVLNQKQDDLHNVMIFVIGKLLERRSLIYSKTIYERRLTKLYGRRANK